jgi:hypothetical protein
VRITPVTGDLPALATSPPPPVRHSTEPAPPPATPPVQQTAATDTDSGAAAGDRRRAAPEPFFDPPLIAQRAVLGLPTGPLIAGYARSQGITYAAAAAAVDRAMPRQDG